MSSTYQKLEDLAAEARRGNAFALTLLREQLQGSMIRLVRRVMDQGTPQLPEHQRVHTLARALAPDAGKSDATSKRRLVEAVANCLCDRALGRVRCQEPLETVRG